MTAGIILKIVLTFAKDNWRAFVIGGLAALALWIFCDWRGQAAEIAALEYEVKVERQLTRQWRDVARLQSETAAEAARLRDEFERKLEEHLANPPDPVFVPSAPEIVTIIQEAEDCSSAVEDVGRKMKELLEGRTP